MAHFIITLIHSNEATKTGSLLSRDYTLIKTTCIYYSYAGSILLDAWIIIYAF